MSFVSFVIFVKQFPPTRRVTNKDKTYIAVASYVMTAGYNSHHSSLVAAHVDYIMANAHNSHHSSLVAAHVDYIMANAHLNVLGQSIGSPDSLTLHCCVLAASQTASLVYYATMNKTMPFTRCLHVLGVLQMDWTAIFLQ